MLETFHLVAGGLNPALKTTLLKARSGVGAMANFNMQETLSPPPYYMTQIRPLEGHGIHHLGSPMSIDMRDEAVKKRCVPTPRRTGARSMVVGTWRMDFSMGIGMQ